MRHFQTKIAHLKKMILHKTGRIPNKTEPRTTTDGMFSFAICYFQSLLKTWGFTIFSAGLFARWGGVKHEAILHLLPKVGVVYTQGSYYSRIKTITVD